MEERQNRTENSTENTLNEIVDKKETKKFGEVNRVLVIPGTYQEIVDLGVF